MTTRGFICILCAAMCVLSSCGRTEIREGGIVMYSSPDKYNVRVIAVDNDIRNPEYDRRCYYRLIFDKVHELRTSTGLESQEKTCEIMLAPNRHLLVIEKWVLDESEGKYVKLNNVEQPRPSYFYFDLPENRILIITITSDRSGKVKYTTDYQRLK